MACGAKGSEELMMMSGPPKERKEIRKDMISNSRMKEAVFGTMRMKARGF